MKKINVLLAILLFSGAAIFTSCSDDDDDNVDVTPSIAFKGGSSYTDEDTEVTVGDSVKVGITANANDNSGEPLDYFEVTSTYNNDQTVVHEEDIDTDFLSQDFWITVNNVGPSRWEFIVTDEAGEMAEVSLTLTGVESDGPIHSYEEKVMGSYNNTEDGSSFASADGELYLINEAIANAAKIDWMYSYGASTEASLMAPSDDLADAFFGGNMDDFAVRNETKFKMLSGVDFDAIDDDGPIVENTMEGVTETSLTQLQEGDLIGFITDPDKAEFGGKHGIIRIDAINAGVDGSLEISVKVQQ